MMIKDLHISNFKSFQDARIEKLGRFNVIIGANASGKSNFIQIFRFLRDIANHGLNNAISLQGGSDYVRNTRLASSEVMRFKIVYDAGLELKRRNIGIRIHDVVYEFAIRFHKRGKGFTVVEDSLAKSLEFLAPPGPGPGPGKKTAGGTTLGRGQSVLTNRKGKIDYRLDLPRNVPLDSDDIVPAFFKDERLRPDALLLETPFFEFVHRFEKFFERMAIYDFDPRLPKKSVSVTGKRDLEEDGSNLALVLKEITADREKKRKFTNLIRNSLPFVEDLNVEKIGDSSLLFKMREVYSRDLYFPADVVSDGTIMITALIIALYFEDKSLLIIEEPEKSLYPFLIPKVVTMMKEAAENKQILVTTHHPEIVKCAELKNIILISRGREGFSTVSKPGERKEVRTFLEHEVGIEDLFIQNLLDQDNHET
jgi:predicted ATPase